jgi:hypothetical protein
VFQIEICDNFCARITNFSLIFRVCRPRQVLKHNNKTLPYDGTVKDMGIQPGDDLGISIFRVPIQVRTWNGPIVQLSVDPTELVSDLKAILEPETGIQQGNQILSLNGHPFSSDKKQICEYGVESGSVLDLEPRSIDIAVETPDGATHEIHVALNDNTEDIKKAIESVSGMPVSKQVVKHKNNRGRQLPKDGKVRDMLKDKDTLQVDVVKIPITVTRWDGKVLDNVMVEPTQSLLDIKKQLEDEGCEIPVNNQSLSLKGKDLADDSKTASACGIVSGSMLDLEQKIIHVDVKTQEGTTHTVALRPADQTPEIKQKIAEATGIAVPRQVVRSRKVILPDSGKTCRDMQIKDGSLLTVEIYKVPIMVNIPDGKRFDARQRSSLFVVTVATQFDSQICLIFL